LGAAWPASSTAVDPVSGQSFVDYYDIFTVGAGYLDLEAALQNISSVPATGTAASPLASYNGTTGVVSLSLDSSTMWYSQSVSSARSVWGAQSVWGAAVLDGNQCVWGARSVWGATSTSSSSQSVWGARSVWGAGSVWAASTSDAAEAANIAIHGEPQAAADNLLRTGAARPKRALDARQQP
jgi:serine protease AprX